MNNNISSDSGELRVSVGASSAVIPLENAVVRITDRDSSFVIEELRTDSSGQTPAITLASPPTEYSMEPGYNKPYSEYSVTVTSPGFDSVEINGVQILPESSANQSVVLAPGEAQENIVVAQNTLWGNFPPKIPEDEVKPLPDDPGFIVLDRAVIPESLVVHLGTPQNSSARNVTVGFTDYIKNVACCEIYATWPRETIKANVIAIISLTLNRIYTEWYRSQGYSFTITNSTAYDQAFSYERNIFDEISDVVDEVFTTYITKPGINQPLFAQYCDGQRVNCQIGMQQWGSKYLGDQGYSAIRILRNYYGSDVFYATASQVEGIPLSYPGNPLTVGSSGAAVRTIQNQLNRISQNYPAIPRLAVDGVYGSSTAASVREFQEIFNLPQTGVVDFATWYKLSYIFVAVERLAEPPER